MSKASLKILVSHTMKKSECVTWAWSETSAKERKITYVGPLSQLTGMPGLDYDLIMVSRAYYEELIGNDDEPQNA